MDNRPLAKLIADLRSEDRKIRCRAVEALGSRKDAAAVPAIVELLEDTRAFPDEHFSWRAALALGEIGDPTAIPALSKALKSSSRDVGMSAANALRKIGGSAVIPALLEGLEHPDGYIRGRAAQALGDLRDVSAVGVLLDTLQRPDEDSYPRAEIITALGQIGDCTAFPVLREALKEPDVRSSAIWALGALGHAEAVPDLLDALQDTDAHIRRSAAAALGDIADVSAMPGLTIALKDRELAVRRGAADALGRIGQPAVPILLEASREEEHVAPTAAVATCALEKIGEPAITALVTELQTEFPDARRGAACVLGRIGAFAAIPALVEALQDTCKAVRLTAAFALVECREAREWQGHQVGEWSHWPVAPVAAVLISALQDEDLIVRQKAAATLRKLGSSRELPRAILIEARFSVQERIDLLENLRHVHYRDQNTVLQYRFPDTVTLCQRTLKERDIALQIRQEVQAVLDQLLLLRASRPTSGNHAEELVRPIHAGTSASDPTTLLRPSDSEDQTHKPPAFWKRLFRKWKEASS